MKKLILIFLVSMSSFCQMLIAQQMAGTVWENTDACTSRIEFLDDDSFSDFSCGIDVTHQGTYNVQNDTITMDEYTISDVPISIGGPLEPYLIYRYVYVRSGSVIHLIRFIDFKNESELNYEDSVVSYVLNQELTFDIANHSSKAIESYIVDKDGYTNVRDEKSSSSGINSRIVEAEIFACTPSDQSNWWKVKTKHGIHGFVHKSRIVTIPNQTEVINRFFKEVENSDTNDAEFAGGNEQIFIYAEKFPKSFLGAFHKCSEQLKLQITKEMESPIHDLIDLKLIYDRINEVENLEESKTTILKALFIAGKKMNLDLSK